MNHARVTRFWRERTRGRLSAVIAAAIIGAIAPAAWAAETEPAPSVPAAPSTTPDQGNENGDQEANRREIARRLIASRLERLQEIEASLERSLELLRTGEPIEAVRREADKAMDAARGFGPMFQGRGPARGNELGPQAREPRDPLGGPGPRGEGPGGRPPRPFLDSLTPEQRRAALEILRERGPQMFERLQRLERERPGEFDRVLRQRLPAMLDWMREREEDPAAFELRTRTMELERKAAEAARRAKDSGGADSEAAGQLRGYLNELFDVRVQMGERELQRLSDRIEKIRQDITSREGERGPMIERRLLQMIENPPPHPPGPPGPSGPPGPLGPPGSRPPGEHDDHPPRPGAFRPSAV